MELLILCCFVFFFFCFVSFVFFFTESIQTAFLKVHMCEKFPITPLFGILSLLLSY